MTSCRITGKSSTDVASTFDWEVESDLGDSLRAPSLAYDVRSELAEESVISAGSAADALAPSVS